MTLLRPFRAMLPRPDLAQAIAAPPYDVLSREEAGAWAAGRPHSFLHVSRPEIDLSADIPADAPAVYERAARNMARLVDDGAFAAVGSPTCYVYRATEGAHSQIGVAGAVPLAAYLDGRLRRHELTRPDKVADRARHLGAVGLHASPVMLAHRDDPRLERAAARIAEGPPTIQASVDGVAHAVWVPEGVLAEELNAAAAAVPRLYVADGHHRCAAAAALARGRDSRGAALLGVAFPESRMRILAYNRAVADLNGCDAAGLRARLSDQFSVAGADRLAMPDRARCFGMYVDGRWYRLALRRPPEPETDPVALLDVEILARTVLAPILGVVDPTRDDRISFVGGSRGLAALAQRVDSGEMAVAFALYPTQLEELLAVADAGGTMPPKSTWFDPKLADGLLLLPLASEDGG